MKGGRVPVPGVCSLEDGTDGCHEKAGGEEDCGANELWVGGLGWVDVPTSNQHQVSNVNSLVCRDRECCA